MIAEEILMVMERFSEGELITLTTEDDELLQRVVICGMDTSHLTIRCPYHFSASQQSKVPWDDISMIIQYGITIEQELKGCTKPLNLKFMKSQEMEVVTVEILSLSIPGQKYITWSDPFTIVIDGIVDIPFGRNLYSTPDDRVLPAGTWELHSNGLWGLLSWDSEIVEIGKA